MGRFLGLGLALALLAGCVGAQAVVPNAVISAPQSVAPALRINTSASRGNLVYLAVYGGVSVYSYPDGKHIGTLTGVKNSVALCSDTSGNVWVIESHSHDRSILLKYAHDGAKPIASLTLKGHANACSVDPSSGNLAAGTLNSNVAVWTNGQGSPTLYSTSAFFKEVSTISYDGSGDLYMRSLDGREPGAWLPKDGTTVMQFHVTKLGSYGWDGRFFVVGPAGRYPESLTLYKLRGGSGKVAAKVSLKNCAPGYEPASFAIAGSELAVSCGIDETNSLNYYKYPQGGNAIKIIVPGETGSVAISVVPPKE
jgi:hypothetical protein